MLLVFCSFLFNKKATKEWLISLHESRAMHFNFLNAKIHTIFQMAKLSLKINCNYLIERN